jgi:hypothetical protein
VHARRQVYVHRAACALAPAETIALDAMDADQKILA